MLCIHRYRYLFFLLHHALQWFLLAEVGENTVRGIFLVRGGLCVGAEVGEQQRGDECNVYILYNI